MALKTIGSNPITHPIFPVTSVTGFLFSERIRYMIFNYWGLVLFISVMILNIIYAVRCPEGFENRWKNKLAQIIEHIGRYGV